MKRYFWTALALIGLSSSSAATPALADSVENMHLLHRAMMNQRTHPAVIADLPEPFQVLLGKGDWAGWVGLLDSWGMDFNTVYRDLDPSDGEVLILGGTLWEAHRPVLVLRASDYRLLALRYPLAPPPPAVSTEETVPTSEEPIFDTAEPPAEDQSLQSLEAATDVPATPEEAESNWSWATVTFHYDTQGRADALAPGWWPPPPPPPPIEVPVSAEAMPAEATPTESPTEPAPPPAEQAD